mmetsp:Transcript_6633/g.11722  ORF Transcript_6633/g.11722 Transcript_6633/m.11722 type:complete len:214 (-) Transcript_6633:126-767(-)|eukprot:CAMPEP_0203774560 /NCGR_PEP_ID=MMETSP0099_2-20121227/5428_1 /ASSEMBLY_ACC=CAM_ASM_000209 /TAXON_ID=96639 /ORGANISM=" , Strain NY0313808BC1" /LENGTH=213 /DNA_ID=CAMNT_0050672809 /DNA_START=213 /DNA_END=854 /DNA_ORIENTATION=+
MNHRVETNRCRFKIPSEEVSHMIYEKRLPALFNAACKNFDKDAFVWRSSNIPGRYRPKGPGLSNLIENLNHKVDYKGVGVLNNLSATAATLAGFTPFDFEKVHEELHYPGQDRVHAAPFTNLFGLKALLTPTKITSLCKGRTGSQLASCKRVFEEIHDYTVKASKPARAKFWNRKTNFADVVSSSTCVVQCGSGSITDSQSMGTHKCSNLLAN